MIARTRVPLSSVYSIMGQDLSFFMKVCITDTRKAVISESLDCKSSWRVSSMVRAISGPVRSERASNLEDGRSGDRKDSGYWERWTWSSFTRRTSIWAASSTNKTSPKPDIWGVLEVWNWARLTLSWRYFLWEGPAGYVNSWKIISVFWLGDA